MRIKFKAGDPRAGTIAQMDSIRGQELIDCGAAVRVKDDGADEAPVEASADADATLTTGDVAVAGKAAKGLAESAKAAAKASGKAKK